MKTTTKTSFKLVKTQTSMPTQLARGVRKHIRQEKARLRRLFEDDPKKAKEEIVKLMNSFTQRKEGASEPSSEGGAQG